MPDTVIHLFVCRWYKNVLAGKWWIRHSALQNDLDELVKWADEWQLRFNVSKCKVMHIGIRKEASCMSMIVDGERLQLKETTLDKALGIWFSSDLKPSEHVAKAVSNVNQILGLIRRTFTYMDIPTMKQLFTTLFRPHLEYGNVVWHPMLRKDKYMIKVVQHRATKMNNFQWCCR